MVTCTALIDDILLDIETLMRELELPEEKIIPDFVSDQALADTIKGYTKKYAVDPVVRRVLRKRYRTWIPEPESAFEYERRELIDRGKLNRIFAQSGIEGEVDAGLKPDWCDIYYRSLFKVPDYRTILDFATASEPDRTWLEGVIKQNLYHDDDLKHLSRAARNLAIKDQVEEYIYAKFTEIDLGILGESEFDAVSSFLDLGSQQSKVVEGRLSSQLAARDVKIRKDVEATRLTNGLIEPEDYVDRVIAVGVDPKLANTEAELIMAQRGIIWEPPP